MIMYNTYMIIILYLLSFLLKFILLKKIKKPHYTYNKKIDFSYML